jgi:hypothetical protein
MSAASTSTFLLADFRKERLPSPLFLSRNSSKEASVWLLIGGPLILLNYGRQTETFRGIHVLHSWEARKSTDLVYEALRVGFRNLDTDVQPKNYREDFDGEGIRKAISEEIVKRPDRRIVLGLLEGILLLQQHHQIGHSYPYYVLVEKYSPCVPYLPIIFED